MSALFTLPKQIPLNAGAILPGALLYFYQTGTSTLQNTYQDNARATAHENPVEADANGVFPAIYLDPTLPDYRVKLTTADDVLVYQLDDIPSNQNTQQSVRLESTNPFVFLYDTDGTSGSRKYRIRAAGAAFEVQASNEAENVFTTILRYEAGILYSNQTEVAVTGTGTFTGTLTGMSSATTGTIHYRTINNICVLWADSSIEGTSNSTAMTLTGLPVACQPSGDRDSICIVEDNSSPGMGRARIAAGLPSIVSFSLIKADLGTGALTPNVSGFTNSGTKGLIDGWSIMYTLS